jgi:hypothetical protein
MDTIGIKIGDIGLNLDQTVFHIKMKRISAPSTWEYDLLHKNFGGEWTTIVNAKWSGKDVVIDLPANINQL